MFSKNYKIKKLDKNIYTVTGSREKINAFLKDFKLSENKNGVKIKWETESIYTGNEDILVDPFSLEIISNSEKFIRKFAFKKYINTDYDRKDIRYSYGTMFDIITVKYEMLFPILQILCKKIINIISVTYDDIEVECMDNVPKYWQYPEYFALVTSAGRNRLAKDESLKEHWTEDENGIYSGYITDREYGVLAYEAYDKIKGHIFKKWNKSYQNVVDIFSEDIDKIEMKNIKYTITSLIGNVRTLDKDMETRKNFIKTYSFGSLVTSVPNKEDYDKSPVKEIIQHEYSDFEKDLKLLNDFRYVKLYLKKGNYIPDNTANSYEIIEDYHLSPYMSTTYEKYITGYYPVKIEFIGNRFETVANIIFDEYGVATFNGFSEHSLNI
jgi:hypothetical protein